MSPSGLSKSQLFNGLFGEKNYPLMGDSFTINPGIANGSEGMLNVQYLSKSMALTAVQKYNNVHSIITVNSYPISLSPITVSSSLAQQMLQISLSFISGGATFGDQRDPLPVPPLLNIIHTLSPEIIIDATDAVISLTSASQFTVRYRYISRKNIASGPFVAGETFGVNYRTNIGFSYGTPKSIQSWYTDYLTEMGAKAVSTSPYIAIWAKPQFAEALTINLLAPIKLLTGYIYITFYDAYFNPIRNTSYDAPFTSFPLIRWPHGAAYVQFDTTNLISTGISDAVLLTPVHAILF